MSFWLKLGLTITDLTVFQQQCARHQVQYTPNEDANFKMQGHPVVAVLRDLSATGYSREAYLVRMQGGLKLLWDNDANYSSLSRRIGANGGVLTRDYTTQVIRNTAQAAGGFIMGQEECPDGSVLLKVGVA